MTASYCCGSVNFTFDSGEQAGFKMQFANYGPETIDQAKPYFLSCTIRITVWNGGNLT